MEAEEEKKEEEKMEREFMRTIRRFGKLNASSLFEGISRGEFAVLAALGQHHSAFADEKVRVSALAEMVDSSPQALSRTLRSLEGKGLIERRPDPRDRRNTCVGLTEKSYDVMERGKRRMEQIISQVVERMGREEFQELIFLLNRLSDVMQDIISNQAEHSGKDGADNSLRKKNEEDEDA